MYVGISLNHSDTRVVCLGSDARKKLQFEEIEYQNGNQSFPSILSRCNVSEKNSNVFVEYFDFLFYYASQQTGKEIHGVVIGMPEIYNCLHWQLVRQFAESSLRKRGCQCKVRIYSNMALRGIHYNCINHNPKGKFLFISEPDIIEAAEVDMGSGVVEPVYETSSKLVKKDFNRQSDVNRAFLWNISFERGLEREFTNYDKIVWFGERLPNFVRNWIEKMKEKNIQVEIRPERASYGAALYAAKLEGVPMTEEVLALVLIPNDISFTINDDKEIQYFLIGHDACIPAKYLMSVPAVSDYEGNISLKFFDTFSENMNPERILHKMLLDGFRPGTSYDLEIAVDVDAKCEVQIGIKCIQTGRKWISRKLNPGENSIEKKEDKNDSEMIQILINTLDHLRMAVSVMEVDKNCESYIIGFEQIEKGALQSLQKLGISKIAAVGCQFDVNYHHAVQTETHPYCKSGTIIRELRSGYMQKGKILRYSEVVVVR